MASLRTHHKRRLLLWFLALLILAGAIAVEYRRVRTRQLWPLIVHRLDAVEVIHAGWLDYPWLIAPGAQEGSVDAFEVTGPGYWVDACGQRCPEPEVPFTGSSPYVSPRGSVVAWEGDTGLRWAWRDGRRARESLLRASPAYVNDDGIVVTDDKQAFTPDGKTLKLRRNGHPCVFPNYLCDDPGYLTVTDQQDGKLYLYDRAARRFLGGYPNPTDWRGMVFHHGDRFLIVEERGKALVCDANGVLATYGANTHWIWGDDGSVWTVGPRHAFILHWRDPKITLTALRVPPRDALIFDVSRVRVWGDGALVAYTETVSASSKRLRKLWQQIRSLTHAKAKLPAKARRLTVLCRGRLLGTTCLPMVSDEASATEGYVARERIPFSADGRYLSWEFKQGRERRIAVYRMP